MYDDAKLHVKLLLGPLRRQGWVVRPYTASGLGRIRPQRRAVYGLGVGMFTVSGAGPYTASSLGVGLYTASGLGVGPYTASGLGRIRPRAWEGRLIGIGICICKNARVPNLCRRHASLHR